MMPAFFRFEPTLSRLFNYCIKFYIDTRLILLEIWKKSTLKKPSIIMAKSSYRDDSLMQRCSIKFSQYSQENNCVFNKFGSLQACSFIKKRLQDRCFLVNIAKFLGKTILKDICERLLLKSWRKQVFCKKGILKYLLKLTGKHLYWSLFFNEVTHCMPTNFLKKDLWAQHNSLETYCVWFFLKPRVQKEVRNSRVTK